MEDGESTWHKVGGQRFERLKCIANASHNQSHRNEHFLGKPTLRSLVNIGFLNLKKDIVNSDARSISKASVTLL